MKNGLLALMSICLSALVALGSAVPAEAAETNPRGLNQWVLGSLPENAAAVRALGAGSVRVDLPWAQVEPGPQRFDWTGVDAVVAAAHANGIQVLFTLRSISAWGTSVAARPGDLYHGASLPKSMADWQQFVGALAARYKGQGLSYEIENEVDTNFWAGSLADYLQLLKASYGAIKSSDPQARVLASALGCGILFDFQKGPALQRYLERSDGWLGPILATRAYDAVNVHDYYFPSGPVVNGFTFSSYLRHTIDMMAKAGVKDRPIWITETGFVSTPARAGQRVDGGSPEKQAGWLTDAFRQAAALNVERTFWLFLRDAEGTGYFDSMGLAGADGVPRPAQQAFTSLGR